MLNYKTESLIMFQFEISISKTNKTRGFCLNCKSCYKFLMGNIHYNVYEGPTHVNC